MAVNIFFNFCGLCSNISYHRRCIWGELVQWFCDVLTVVLFVASAAAAAYLRSDTTFSH